MQNAKEILQEKKDILCLLMPGAWSPCDHEKLKDLNFCISRLIKEHPDITEFDLNPVRVCYDSILLTSKSKEKRLQ
jgi:hypothetical protein